MIGRPLVNEGFGYRSGHRLGVARGIARIRSGSCINDPPCEISSLCPDHFRQDMKASDVRSHTFNFGGAVTREQLDCYDMLTAFCAEATR